MLRLVATWAPPPFKGMYAGKKSVSTASVHSSSVGSVRSWHILNKVFSISRSIWRRKFGKNIQVINEGIKFNLISKKNSFWATEVTATWHCLSHPVDHAYKWNGELITTTTALFIPHFLNIYLHWHLDSIITQQTTCLSHRNWTCRGSSGVYNYSASMQYFLFS